VARASDTLEFLSRGSEAYERGDPAWIDAHARDLTHAALAESTRKAPGATPAAAVAPAGDADADDQ
jgi:hypothetical protein